MHVVEDYRMIMTTCRDSERVIAWQDFNWREHLVLRGHILRDIGDCVPHGKTQSSGQRVADEGNTSGIARNSRSWLLH